ncbi:unnamed protein product [Trifolium pratense]|uniref:Uncharacterized protein n=1 Tax=Trifolium pratense TaxID=57577 RepID=A0ACB0IXB2_TRIPR|nr:unnamed protein product [Trifolium pratense]
MLLHNAQNRTLLHHSHNRMWISPVLLIFFDIGTFQDTFSWLVKPTWLVYLGTSCAEETVVIS